MSVCLFYESGLCEGACTNPMYDVQVTKRIKGSVSSKQHGYEELLSPLIAQVSTLQSLCGTAT